MEMFQAEVYEVNKFWILKFSASSDPYLEWSHRSTDFLSDPRSRLKNSISQQ